MDTDRFYISSEWIAVRDRRRDLDDRRCTVARLLGGTCRGVLHVHHIEPVSDRPDLAFDLSKTATTCAAHHARWEALARSLRARRALVVPPCPHKHRYLSGRKECERRRARRMGITLE